MSIMSTVFVKMANDGRLNQWVKYIVILQQVPANFCAIVNSKFSYE